VDEKGDTERIPPPQSIIIQASNPEAENDTEAFATFPDAEEQYDNNKIIVPVGGKPSNQLLGSSFLLIFISTVGFFLGFEAAFDGGGDFICCLVCNGNSIGLVLLGTYSAQYGKWERTSGANISAVFSDIVAALLYIVAAILFVLWLLFVTYESNFAY